MRTRQVVLGVALMFTTLFAFLTIADAVHNGVSVLTVVSIGVLTLFVVGILGALMEPPED